MLGFVDVTRKKRDDPMSISDDLWLRIKTAYQTTKSKPQNYKDLLKVYVIMIRHLTCNDFVISKTLNTKQDKNLVVYSLNDELIKMHLELNGFKNENRTGFHEVARERFNIVETVVEDDNEDCFLDE